ncbi:MAG: TIGR02147 family protein [Bdellovibrionota bacterium]
MLIKLTATTATEVPETDKSLVSDFRIRLQRELVKRCQANPKFSLRAFARFLGVESSRLSKILRGERPVGPELFKKFAGKLNLSPTEIEYYRINLQAQRFKVPAEALNTNSNNHRYLQLSQDVFESIEDWRHYAILELMKVESFQPTVKWLSQVLGINPSEIRAYIERLERIGLLEIKPDGTWHDCSDGFSTHVLSETQTTSAHRRSQAKILDLAIEALSTVPMDKRDQSSMMVATHSSKIIEAKKRIKKFRRELAEFLEDCKTKDTVYQLGVSLFPLVEPKNTNLNHGTN